MAHFMGDTGCCLIHSDTSKKKGQANLGSHCHKKRKKRRRRGTCNAALGVIVRTAELGIVAGLVGHVVQTGELEQLDAQLAGQLKGSDGPVQLCLLPDGEAVGQKVDGVHALHGFAQQVLGLNMAHVEGDVGQLGELLGRRVVRVACLHSHLVSPVAGQG
jgi:hypothetical protein